LSRHRDRITSPRKRGEGEMAQIEGNSSFESPGRFAMIR
jgi:hypothetical protein